MHLESLSLLEGDLSLVRLQINTFQMPLNFNDNEAKQVLLQRIWTGRYTSLPA